MAVGSDPEAESFLLLSLQSFRVSILGLGEKIKLCRKELTGRGYLKYVHGRGFRDFQRSSRGFMVYRSERRSYESTDQFIEVNAVPVIIRAFMGRLCFIYGYSGELVAEKNRDIINLITANLKAII